MARIFEDEAQRTGFELPMPAEDLATVFRELGSGLGLAKVLVKAGAKVVMADVRQDHLDEAIEWFARNGQKDNVLGVQLDVTDRAAYERELAEKGKGLLDELYSKYLDRSHTTSIWSELVEP